MTDFPLQVAPSEAGVLRIFTLDGTAGGAKTLRAALAEGGDAARARAAEALGVDRVDPWWITPVDPGDLAGMGLAAYLVEGHDVARDRIDAARDALPDPDATLILVQSPAFGGTAPLLRPASWLRPAIAFDVNRPAAPSRPMPAADAGQNAPEPPEAPRLRPTPGLPGVPVLAILAAAAIVVALVAILGAG